MPVEVRYYTDPVCAWSWAAEPLRRRLEWEFGDQLEFRWVMGGLGRRYDADYRDEQSGAGAGNPLADLVAHWLEVAADSGMPFDPRIWTRSPLGSSYPACQAVRAAAEQGAEAASRYLRRLREGVMAELKKLDHAEALIGEAAAAGLDVERFRIDLRSHAITEGFAADLDEVRAPPAAAAASAAVTTTEGRERVVFPTAVFNGPAGAGAAFAPRRYEELRDAALAAGAEPVTDGRPAPLEAVERFGRLATRELEELTGMPTPVLMAELWGHARDWRLRAAATPGGTFWESALSG